EAMYVAIETKALRLGGNFSVDQNMTDAGYAIDTQERVADLKGAVITAQVLSSAKLYPKLQDRRALYLASTALFRDPPATASATEEVGQKKRSSDAHSANVGRRLELMIDPIRRALDCTLSPQARDQLKDCSK